MKVQIKTKIDIAYEQYKVVFASKISKFSKLDYWLEKESGIFLEEIEFKNKKYFNFKRGEVIKVDFGVNIGSEFSHTHYAIVLNKDDTIFNDNITVVPISSKSRYKRVYLGKLLLEMMPKTKKYNLDSYAVITQIKTISKKRIYKMKTKYRCGDVILNKIDEYICEYLVK